MKWMDPPPTHLGHCPKISLFLLSSMYRLSKKLVTECQKDRHNFVAEADKLRAKINLQVEEKEKMESTLKVMIIFCGDEFAWPITGHALFYMVIVLLA